jgi:hypothetical protein
MLKCRTVGNIYKKVRSDKLRVIYNINKYTPCLKVKIKYVNRVIDWKESQKDFNLGFKLP